MEKSDLLNLVIESLNETLSEMDDFDQSDLPPLNGNTRLVGRQALLSSLGLVSLIVDIEEKLVDEHEILVTIANERAMSQKKSPFRSVEMLTDYISLLISEQR